ncbi:hypothetical protein EIN_275190 [Entamoeba invadens IP1]|uniref:Peptidase C1A papain C-terminal domain-containing protein n=1 Tax=Entamoeba invadens IP1 TaxID=370355 RepID=A0A0A1U1P3_ENTIV|nr:hypothetical protein EIN_275190 [Entamoeba invadens IP1]ELP87932.1 hypothetical protein EIN_275190 [Entamoeba invadens IP1]|eukprot:XP_004254703.1 hypothetical protein EIN_275190 [Entamoeba invadens IP1]
MLGFRTNILSVKVVSVRPSPLPKQWSVPIESLTPVKNQFARGTCWAHAVIGFVESDYRANGIRNGLLDPDEVVQFSEQAYMSLLVTYCSKHRDIPLCRYGGMLENSTNNFTPDSFFYLRNVTNGFILPETICPYEHFSGVNESLCTPSDKQTLEEHVKRNPLSFSIKDIVTVYSVNDVKNIMLKTLSPMTYGLNTLFNTILLPCNSFNPQINTTECQKCLTPCAGGCCTKVSSSMYHNDGLIDISEGSVRRGGHSMLVVGWNDEFPVERNLHLNDPIFQCDWAKIDVNHNSSHPPQNNSKNNNTATIKNVIEKRVKRWTKGGLILKNSYGTKGHTLGFYLQNHSLLNEDTICPLSIHPSRWYPLDVNCIKEGRSFMNCSNGKLRKIGNSKIFYGATILKCKEGISRDEAKNLGFEECGTNDPKTRYALSAQWYNVTFKRAIPKTLAMGDGFLLYLAKWENGKINTTIQETRTLLTSWDFVTQLFEMDTNVTNSEHCGYYFQPYDTIEYLASEFGHDTFESYGFSYYCLKWEPESYYKVSKHKSKFKGIRESTKKFVTPQFDGPFGGRAN